MKQENKQFQRTEDGHLILMTPEERKLLITDLTSRIEYGVICMIERVDDCGPRWRNEKLTGFCNEEEGYFYFDFCYGLAVDFAEKVKPYLRPLLSMTEEEIVELKWLNEKCDAMPTFEYVPVENYRIYDWMNRHHFDFRNLIEKGLALEAPADMYNIEEE